MSAQFTLDELRKLVPDFVEAHPSANAFEIERFLFWLETRRAPTESAMKLYAWVPEGTIGQYAIVVIAESETEALVAAEAVVAKIRREDRSASHYLRGWGEPDHYKLTVRASVEAISIMIG